MDNLPNTVILKAIELEINPKVTLLVKELNKSDAPWVATHMDELQARWDEIVELCKLRQQVAERIRGGGK